jgi:hypothetical protein
MSALGGGEGWWGETCSCYFGTLCHYCQNYSETGQTNGIYLSSKCETSNEIYMVEQGEPDDTASCSSYSVPCGNFIDCTGENCEGECSVVNQCTGCSAPAEGSSECSD